MVDAFQLVTARTGEVQNQGVAVDPRATVWTRSRRRPALTQIAPIVRADVSSDNQAQTDEALIRPILGTLSHTFMPCQAQERSSDHRRSW